MSKAKRAQASNGAESLDGSMTAPGALVFISHDTRDAALAEAFSSLLTNVSGTMLKSFRSSDKSGGEGLEYGTNWYPQIIDKLQKASDVVCLLTQRSLDRPWILFEAGVAQGKLNTRVHGLALGVPMERATKTGPFAQFQNCADDPESVAGLVRQLAQRIPGFNPTKDVVDMQVKAFLESSKKLVKDLDSAKKEDEKKPEDTTAAKLFEEIKVMFQELPERLEGTVSSAIEPRRLRRGKRDHRRLDFLMHFAANELDPATAWLIAISMFREDAPWFYELGLKVYRAMESGKAVEAQRAIEEFRRVTMRLVHSPLGEELMDNRFPSFMLEEFLEHFVVRQLRSRSDAEKSKKQG